MTGEEVSMLIGHTVGLLIALVLFLIGLWFVNKRYR